MPGSIWQIAVDVGGTFCDIVARTPLDETRTHKLLSSGRVKGAVTRGAGTTTIVDARRRNDPDGFWRGWRCVLLDDRGHATLEARVERFDADSGTLHLDQTCRSAARPGAAYELIGEDEAPIVGIRYVMELRPGVPIPACAVRLGTTRATNALLERRGAKTALAITAGFGDLLSIGDQTRPRLFDLDIRKSAPLHKMVVEVQERIDSDGNVIAPLQVDRATEALRALRAEGFESLAICLMNAYRNPAHEETLARLARRVGFSHVSVSTALASRQGFLPRAENCVTDAYLGPSFRDYVSGIAAALPEGSLRLMTGGGGLVAVERFSGAMSIMSGPAGGLVGAADIARQTGYPEVIAFDMGGTSTDVSRFGGAFEYQNDTRIAGARIVTPVLAVETVAAGGGSVCAFDGFRFCVGPESAGNDPGPACYGHNGPLTLTDANLHLGRIHERHFPFPLDRNAVARRFAVLGEEVTASTGRAMTADEMAEGFLEIANANMAEAIRRITIERGIDVREHALVCFGGAGGQHACAVACRLDIATIVVPPNGGVLSAHGIAVADVKRIVERPVHSVHSGSLDADLAREFAEMEEEGRRALIGEGVPPERIDCIRWLDVRYAGEGSTLAVPADDAVRRFEFLHRRRFGYVHAGRAIVVVSARIEAIGGTDKPTAPTAEPIHRAAPAAETASVVFSGRSVATSLHDRAALRAGDRFEGPAIVTDTTSTLVVEPGWLGTVAETGSIVLARSAGAGLTELRSTEADPVGLELFDRRFSAIAEQMGAALRRTAMSTNVKERLDYSCAVFNREGELIANAPHIPVHLGSMGACVKAVMEDMPDIGPQDVVVTNDPFRGGTHLPDITVVSPVFLNDAPAFFVASRAHHAEIGGVQPGSMPPGSTDLSQEGVLIQCFKVVDGGSERFDALRQVLALAPHPSRCPDENVADIVAQIAANRAGAEALHTLVEQHGWFVVDAFTKHVRDAAAAKMRRAIRKLPDGEFNRSEWLDNGAAIRVRIVVNGERATVDFTGTSGTLPGNLNATRAIATSAVLYCFRCLIDEDIALNAGVLEPIDLIVPPSLLNPETRGAAVAGGNVETSQRIVDCILGALGVVAASQGTMNNIVFGNERFAYYETICGGSGAGPTFDGAHAVHTHMTNTRMTDPEILEARYPVRLHRFVIRHGSGGRGRHCGGDGCIREIEFLERLELSMITQRRTTQPSGLDGGDPGAAGVNRVLRSSGAEERLGPIAHVVVHPGDRLIIETPGGGGFGPATERPRNVDEACRGLGGH